MVGVGNYEERDGYCGVAPSTITSSTISTGLIVKRTNHNSSEIKSVDHYVIWHVNDFGSFIL